MRRDALFDFFVVYAHHHDIHKELLNWARVVRVSRAEPNDCAPLFRLYRSTDAHEVEQEAPSGREPIRRQDGWDMERQVRILPDKHLAAIRWAYVKSHKPTEWACRQIGVTKPGLIELIHAGRSMLVNRSK